MNIVNIKIWLHFKFIWILSSRKSKSNVQMHRSAGSSIFNYYISNISPTITLLIQLSNRVNGKFLQSVCFLSYSKCRIGCVKKWIKYHILTVKIWFLYIKIWLILFSIKTILLHNYIQSDISISNFNKECTIFYAKNQVLLPTVKFRTMKLPKGRLQKKKQHILWHLAKR